MRFAARQACGRGEYWVRKEQFETTFGTPRDRKQREKESRNGKRHQKWAGRSAVMRLMQWMEHSINFLAAGEASFIEGTAIPSSTN